MFYFAFPNNMGRWPRRSAQPSGTGSHLATDTEVISRQTVTETAQLRQEVEVLGAIVHGIFQWCFKDASDGYPIDFSLLFMVQWCIKMPFGNLTICYRQLSMSVGDLCWFYWFTQQKNVAVPFSTKNCWVSWGYFLVVTARPLPGASKNISPEHRHSVAPGSFGKCGEDWHRAQVRFWDLKKSTAHFYLVLEWPEGQVVISCYFPPPIEILCVTLP